MPSSTNVPVVHEQRDPLARGQLAALVLLVDLLLPAAQPDLRAAILEVLDQRAQQRGGLLLGAHVLIQRTCRARVHVRARPCLRAVHHRPFHTGSRFSKNALTPSTMSSVDSASVSCARR